MRIERDLTKGNIYKGLMLFSLPLIAGNLLQQCYNLVDTWVVGRYLGKAALGAVGSSFMLMALITSILTGLCMGSSVVFSQFYGENKRDDMKTSMVNAFVLIALLAVVVQIAVYLLLPLILILLRVPAEAVSLMTDYLSIIFLGIFFVFLYNYVAAMLRSIGNSTVPLLFLLFSTVLNTVLDILFVPVFAWGVKGAALATVLAQAASAIGILLYYLVRVKELHPKREHFAFRTQLLKRIASVSVLTSMQQSFMYFGIVAIQSLINSFGIETMAAYAAASKIDSFAWSPPHEVASGLATFVAQNAGAKNPDRVRGGFRAGAVICTVMSIIASMLVGTFARPLLELFIDPAETATIAIGVTYLRIEGAFYVGIGILQLLYSTYRGIERAGMSVILTIVSLGTRVLLAYTFAPRFGVEAIWFSILIGWILADITGLIPLRRAIAKKLGTA